jgi:hypothetical protein
MQIMEGDVIADPATSTHIAHFHTGGVPGRARSTGSELRTRLCRAIMVKGHPGIGREFVPSREPMKSLRGRSRSAMFEASGAERAELI